MLADSDAMATIAVKDLETARKFYEEKIGLQLADKQPGVLRFRSGRSLIVLYPSQYAGTNQATVLTWAVHDAEPIASEPRSRGVSFEHCDLPGLTRTDDLHVAGSFKGAWLKDPDGMHILSR